MDFQQRMERFFKKSGSEYEGIGIPGENLWCERAPSKIEEDVDDTILADAEKWVCPKQHTTSSNNSA